MLHPAGRESLRRHNPGCLPIPWASSATSHPSPAELAPSNTRCTTGPALRTAPTLCAHSAVHPLKRSIRGGTPVLIGTQPSSVHRNFGRRTYRAVPECTLRGRAESANHPEPRSGTVSFLNSQVSSWRERSTNRRSVAGESRPVGDVEATVFERDLRCSHCAPARARKDNSRDTPGCQRSEHAPNFVNCDEGKDDRLGTLPLVSYVRSYTG